MKQLTLPELETIAEDWRQRSHKLRKIWRNPETDYAYAIKALKLWTEMSYRVLNIDRIIRSIELRRVNWIYDELHDCSKAQKSGSVETIKNQLTLEL